MRFRGKSAVRAVFWIAALCACGRAGAGDDEFRLFSLRGWDGYFLFQAEHRKYDTGGTTTTSLHYNEQLFLGTNGSLYHRNLFDFRLGGLFGYSQDSFSRAGEDDSDSGKILGYEFEAHILKEKLFGFTVYAEDRQQWLPRAFLPSYQLNTVERGIRWQVVEPWLFSKLEISELGYDYDRYDPYTGLGRSVNDFRIQYDADIKFSRNNVLELDYDYLERDDSLSQTLSETSDFFAVHRIRFGDDDADDLQSSYRYYEQLAGIKTVRHTFAEQLHLDHSETLDSWYEYGHETTNARFTGGTSVKTIRESAGASVQHKLYDSLISRVGGRFQRTEFDTTAVVETTEGYGSFSYKKTNPWGHLYVNYGYSQQFEDSDLKEETPVSVIDEPFTFNALDEIIIPTDNVTAGSVVVKALSSIPYTEGPLNDYTVTVYTDRTVIKRTAVSTIAAAESVLVDYQFSPSVDTETTTQTQRVEIGQYFQNGFRIFFIQREKNVDRDPEVVAETDSLVKTIGAEYRKKAFYASAEYETEEKSYPYESTRARVSYSIPVTDRLNTSINSSWSDTKHTGQLSRTVERYDATWRNFYRVNKNLDLTGTLIYRDETDTLYGDSNGFDFVAALNWRYNKTSIRLEYLSKAYDSDNLDSRTNEIRFTLRRVF